MTDINKYVLDGIEKAKQDYIQLINTFNNIQKEIIITEGKIKGLIELGQKLELIDEQGNPIIKDDE